MDHIPRIVLTGGPCSGKTTGIARLKKDLLELGYTPIVVPETATTLIEAGIEPWDRDVTNTTFQEAVLRQQIAAENIALKVAKKYPPHRKPILLCDRGKADGAAYCSKVEFIEILNDMGLKRGQLLEGYDSVHHMVTAAIGAEEFYTLSTNKLARKETPEQARELDPKTRDAWLGHKHLRVIENIPGAGFEDKILRLRRSVLHSLGHPQPLEIERKFLVDRMRLPSTLPVPHVRTQIEQWYLSSKNADEMRIRKAEVLGATHYTLTKKQNVRPGVRVEIERSITRTEYLDLLDGAFKRSVVRKSRTSFVWKNQYFELDILSTPANGLVFLEIELTSEHDAIDLPPWLPATRDVTEDRAYENRSIAVSE